MKGRKERRFRRFNPGEVPSLAISAYVGYRSMDRQTESFVCLGLIVILLQNTGRSQAECSKRYSDAPGQIYDSLQSRASDCGTHKSSCRYRICAPPGHYIVLNITQLSSTPLQPGSGGCSPRVVVKNVGVGNALPLVSLCNGERPLPRVVRSLDNELRVIFRSQAWQTSSFHATFTFHKSSDPPPCIVCPLVQQINKSMNASLPIFPQNKSQNAPTEGSNGVPGDSPSSGAWHMEYFVLVVLAPLTVVCLCCVIMFYYRRSSRYASHSPSSLPNSSYSITSDNTQVPVSHSQSPLVSRQNRFSAQHQQEMLRKQREMVCPRSESTEKFPTSVCLPDEDEPPHMRENVRIHREVMSENGIRAPPNRTVYDSERHDLLIQSQLRNKTENLQRHPVRRSPSSSSSKRGSVIRGGGAGGGGGGGGKQGATNRTALTAAGIEAIDSETRSPLNLIDSDSEGPPPYASLAQINNNIINVCDSTVSTGNSTDGLLQSQQQQQQMPCSPPYQPNSNGRFHGSTRGVGRASSVRLKGTDCV